MQERDEKKLVMRLEGVRFQSPGERISMIGWLSMIGGVDFDKVGMDFSIIVDVDHVSRDDIVELMALFRRFDLGMETLNGLRVLAVGEVLDREGDFQFSSVYPAR